MKGNKLNMSNIKYNSVRMFTPQKIKIKNNKISFHNELMKSENKIIETNNIISNKRYFSNSFKNNKLTFSPNNTLTYSSTHYNKISQCLLINNRYYDILNTDTIPSINNDHLIKNHRNIFNKSTNSLSPTKFKTFSTIHNKFNINLINTDELTKISTLLSSFKSSKKAKNKRNFNIKNIRSNSLLYHLNKNTKLKDSEIQNRYRPIIKEFFGKKDYLKFANKSEKFIKPDEIKMLYKDTKLIKSIFDYLNNSFLKIRYHQAKMNQKLMDELLEKKKNQKYYYHKLEENLALDKFFQIKKIEYDKNKYLSTNNKKIMKNEKINLNNS